LKNKLNGWNIKNELGRKVASDYSMVANQTILIVAVLYPQALENLWAIIEKN
jgi:hypothetical protein